MSNNTTNRKETLEKILTGVNVLADKVRTTSGSMGKTFLIIKKDGKPYITKDGVTIAKAVSCEDPIENMGCALMQQVGELTVNIAGDGTSLTITMAQKLLQLIVEEMNKGTDHRLLLEEIEDSLNEIEKLLEGHVKDINSVDDCIKIATISVNGNEELGKLVGQVMWDARNNGVVNLEDWEEDETVVKQEDGSRYLRSYDYPQMLGKNHIKVAYNNPIVCVYENDVESMHDIYADIQTSISEKRPIVLLAPDFANNVITFLTENKEKANLKALPIIYPGYGDEKIEYFKDIKAMCFNDNIRRILADKQGFTLYTKEFTQEMQDRSDFLQAQIANENTQYYKDILENRLSIIHQKVFTVWVGATSEVEMREIKDRVEDGLLATRSSIEYGYVLGGGLTLWNVSKSLTLNSRGAEIMSEVISCPLVQICENAGILHKIDEVVGGKFGINTTTKQIEDFEKSGIIDPYLVIISALRNSVSVAKSIISLNGAIEHKTEPLKPKFEDGKGFIYQ